MSKEFNIEPNKILDFVLTIQHLDTINTIGSTNNSKIIFLNHEPINRMSSILNNSHVENNNTNNNNNLNNDNLNNYIVDDINNKKE
ncbi:hypothetical protein Hokovirus_3_208 [Hokovirus HKV1]|uniref:Uncharacterized protein n=1 Tax=Hokovirus HKV1 TaxID=1977638 RepID=A0A1V0SGT5_9VIRU|nr:hypothetical protein Hokovirus_3_208 [Hokovirus HKV1]